MLLIILKNFNYNLTGISKQPDTILVQGHFGTSLGKMVSGCRFQSYYPITPASDESVYLESNELLEIEKWKTWFYDSCSN